MYCTNGNLLDPIKSFYRDDKLCVKLKETNTLDMVVSVIVKMCRRTNWVCMLPKLRVVEGEIKQKL